MHHNQFLWLKSHLSYIMEGGEGWFIQELARREKPDHANGKLVMQESFSTEWFLSEKQWTSALVLIRVSTHKVLLFSVKNPIKSWIFHILCSLAFSPLALGSFISEQAIPQDFFVMSCYSPYYYPLYWQNDIPASNSGQFFCFPGLKLDF